MGHKNTKVLMPTEMKSIYGVTVIGCFKELRASAGTVATESNVVTIKSNVKWTISNIPSWIHFKTSDLSGYGDKRVIFSYDAFISDEVFKKRFTTLHIKSTEKGKILSTISVSQTANKSSIGFTTTADGSVVQPDIEVGFEAQTVEFYVYTNSTKNNWVLTGLTGSGYDYITSTHLDENGYLGTKKITVTLEANPELQPREQIFFVGSLGKNVPSDKVVIAQKANVADKNAPEGDDDGLQSIMYGTGSDWNTNIAFTNVLIKRKSSYNYNMIDEQEGEGVIRGLRYSQNVTTIGSQFAISTKNKVTMNKLDSGGNSRGMSGFEYNRDVNNYDKQEFDYGNWNLEGEVVNGSAVQCRDMESLTYKGLYSRDSLVEAHAQEGLLFSTDVALVPDSFGDTGSADDVCTVTLHNVFDPSAAIPLRSVGGLNFDKYTIGEENHSSPTYGTFNPSAIPPNWDNQWNKVYRGGHEDFWLRDTLRMRLGAQRAAIRPTTLEVYVNRKIPLQDLVTKDEDGKEKTTTMFSYMVKSVGYNDDIPDNAILGIQTQVKRRRTVENVNSEYIFSVEFMDLYLDDPNLMMGPTAIISTVQYLEMPQWIAKTLKVVEAVILFVGAVVATWLAIVSFGSTAPVAWASWTAFIIAITMMSIDIYRASRDDQWDNRNKAAAYEAARLTADGANMLYYSIMTSTALYDTIVAGRSFGLYIKDFLTYSSTCSYNKLNLTSRATFNGAANIVAAAVYIYKLYELFSEWESFFTEIEGEKWVSGVNVATAIMYETNTK